MNDYVNVIEEKGEFQTTAIYFGSLIIKKGKFSHLNLDFLNDHNLI